MDTIGPTSCSIMCHVGTSSTNQRRQFQKHPTAYFYIITFPPTDQVSFTRCVYYIYIYIHINKIMYNYCLLQIHMYIHLHINCKYVYTHIYIYIYIYLHACIHTYIYIYIYLCLFMHKSSGWPQNCKNEPCLTGNCSLPPRVPGAMDEPQSSTARKNVQDVLGDPNLGDPKLDQGSPKIMNLPFCIPKYIYIYILYIYIYNNIYIYICVRVNNC